MPIGNTKLIRPEYTAKTNQWIKDNPKEWKQIRSNSKYPFSELQKIMEGLYGKPIWRDRRGRSKITGTLPTKEDPGIGFTIKSQKGGNTVQYMSNATRAATRGQPTGNSSGTRAYLERAASSPDTDFVDSQRAMAEARATGPNMDGGHKMPLDRTVAGQEFKVQNGRGTVEEYRSNFQNSGQTPGHDRRNIEPQTAQDNRIKQRTDYSILDNNLKTLPKSSRLDLILRQVRAKTLMNGGIRGSLLSLAPDIYEVVNSKTNGELDKQVTNGLNYALDNGSELIKNGANGLKNGVNGFVDKLLNAARNQSLSTTNYGQY